jgi:hypothetical protein
VWTLVVQGQRIALRVSHFNLSIAIKKDMCGKTLSDEFLQADLNAAAGRLRPNALVVIDGPTPGLSATLT